MGGPPCSHIARMLHRVRRCHCKPRKLVNVNESARFESVTDAEAGAAGRALCALAVCLDDAIDAKRARDFPGDAKSDL